MRKEMHMPSDRRRILELALESLENKKKQLEQEIADIARELRSATPKGTPWTAKSTGATPVRKRSRFSKDERIRRSQRMKAYWENWRKKKIRQK
jgi:thioesterase domain-containing protein